jgi:S-adenosylmethionine:tRNA ribosyltransferase-isomerase
MPGKIMKLSDFDYRLPGELIAQYPCAKRENSRLLVLDRAKGKIAHRKFSDIIDYFSVGDCLVLNNTRVVSARMIGRRQKLSPSQGGGKQEIFLLESLSENRYRVLARPAKKLPVGAKILFGDGKTFATVLADEGSSRIIKFSPNGNKRNFWNEMGQVPLPPYIKREPEDSDKQRYQTVYAAEQGATAAPTAGLHFTKELLGLIRDKGVNIVSVTLHVNYGTFAPVKCEDIKKHRMHREYFILPGKTKETILSVRAKGKRVFAVGTTSVRVLETCADGKKKEGWTDLFIYPPYKFKAVDCLLTNFHFPKSTLLMLVSAFAGKKQLFNAYQEAVEKKYRFFSYGDAMLIV